MTLVHLTDLLPRRERLLDTRPVKTWLAGKSVAVTGAGYIGSQLVRELAQYNLQRLIAVDNSELNLWKLCDVPRVEKMYGDVRDMRRMRQLLMRCDVVFHAAALKHLPICETASEDAYATNAAGTRHVVEAAEKAFIVLVSTDKAVNPSCVMGKTKKLAEQLVRESGRGCVVRFGNVIGSSGSVVPLWEGQLARGEPITVTDARMTRYFMTVGEAAELILQAGAIGPGTYCLDMGEPVSIDLMAREFIKLSGRRDVNIVYTGVREGEKLHEELCSGSLVPTGVDGVWRADEVVGGMADSASAEAQP